jgi:hypothetical protein
MNLRRYRISKNFYLDELVDAATYHKYNEKGKLYRLARKVNVPMLNALQFLRTEMATPATVNTWWVAYLEAQGDLVKTLEIVDARNLKQWRGWRNPSSSWYKEDSMHTMFMGVDVKFKGAGWLKKARKIIWDNWEKLGVSGMEVGVTWLHFDTRFMVNQVKLFVFNKTSVLKDWTPK